MTNQNTYDPWEQMFYTNTWIMNNFPPIDDLYHYQLISERNKEYEADLKFYEDKEYYNDFNDFNTLN